MGLDAAVYTDDTSETQVVAYRIGNFDNIIRLCEFIKGICPEATFHAGHDWRGFTGSERWATYE
jgi:hypothetical protein